MSLNNKQIGKAANMLAQEYKVAENILFRQVNNEGILLHISSGT